MSGGQTEAPARWQAQPGQAGGVLLAYDTPSGNAARAWKAASLRQTPADRQTIADALGTSDAYATAPFVIAATERGPRLAAALSPPPLLDPEGLAVWDAAPDSDIALIHLHTGAVVLAGEPGSWLCGNPAPRHDMRLFADGRDFARAWAAARAEHIARYRRAAVPGLRASDRPDACTPGFLLAGQFERVRYWGPLLQAGRVLVDDPALIPALRRALVRAAGVPKVEAAALPTARRAA
jgi:hypothetical protein